VCDQVLRLPGYEFSLGEVVLGECGRLAPEIMKRISSGSIGLVENSIPAMQFAQAVDKYRLGAGEVECILLAALHQMVVCTDDKKARRVAETVLGVGAAVGVLTLLQKCIDAKLLTVKDAWAAYELMRSRGAFLPTLREDYFI